MNMVVGRSGVGGGGVAWGGTCLIFVCGCANVVSETVHFLLQFLEKKTPFSCNFFGKKNMLFSLQFCQDVPFFKQDCLHWRIAPKILRNVVK